MKTLFAIFFSLALLGAQSVFLIGAPAAKPVSQCACEKCDTSCCKKKAAPESQPSSSTPAPTRAQIEWQVLAAVLTQLVALPASSKSDVSLRFLPPIPAPAVPLYQRNCSFLI